MRLAKGKFKVEERDVNISELRDADEAFLTATNKEIVPVVKIDDFVINSGKVGSNTQWLMDRFSQFIKAY